ncbi:site-specific integrase [Mycolicibacterium elephantis]|uniref:tyrosine-type recombinase/integrase n=1 Tax=Mycolicibacterium elephantis TaxID=81858 RepID=UPI003A8B9C37
MDRVPKPRQGVENLWVSRAGERTKLYGKGKQYRARYVDTAGKEHTRRFKYKREAEEWLRDITRAGLDVAPPVSGKCTVSQQYSRWIRKADIAQTTQATRRHTWNAHVAEKWGDLELTMIDPSSVKAWVADMKDAGVGVPTIENALGVLRMVLADAVSDNRLIRNPCAGIKPPKRLHRARAYLNHEQVEALAQAVGKDGLVVRLLAYTGLRWGELAALNVGSVDLQRRRLQVDQSVAEVGGRLAWKPPKDHERRSVPFPAFLSDEIAATMSGKARRDLLLSSATGGVIRISTWRPRVFNPARDSLGDDFPRVTPHDLRHTAASLAVSAGGNVLALARMLGHESPKMTLETYADLFDSDLDALAVVLDEARRTALTPSMIIDKHEFEGENVPGTLVRTT